MSDITNRLRELSGESHYIWPKDCSMLNDAADEIERLRAEVERLKAAAVPEGLSEFLIDLNRSRDKYPNNARMFDGLAGEVDELRRAYAGDGDIRADGDSGGNTMLNQQSAAVHESLVNTLKAASIMILKWAEFYGKVDSQTKQLAPGGTVDTLEMIDEALGLLLAAPQPPTAEPKA